MYTTEDEAKSLVDEVTSLLGEVGLRLTKWMSNSRDVLSLISDKRRARPNLDLDLDDLPVERTLGIQWDVERDVFLFKVLEPNQPLTKRGILSAVSSQYDPMGFVCPILLEAKKILQKLWKLNLGWVDEIPEACSVTGISGRMSCLPCHKFRYRSAILLIRQKYLMYFCICSQMLLRTVMACALTSDLLMQVELLNVHSWLESPEVRL